MINLPLLFEWMIFLFLAGFTTFTGGIGLLMLDNCRFEGFTPGRIIVSAVLIVGAFELAKDTIDAIPLAQTIEYMLQ